MFSQLEYFFYFSSYQPNPNTKYRINNNLFKNGKREDLVCDPRLFQQCGTGRTWS